MNRIKNNNINSEKVRKWADTYRNLAEGQVNVGSRRGTSAPVWVTLEVNSAGIPTGNYLAALQKDDVPNADYLTEEGLTNLLNLLYNGNYTIERPEHAALLVFVCLLADEKEKEANTLMRHIGPYMEVLRFYPTELDDVPEITPYVAAQSLRDVKANLSESKGKSSNYSIDRVARFYAEYEAINTWRPLAEDVVRLYCRTVEGPLPEFQVDENGRILTSVDGRPFFTCSNTTGWPLKIIDATFSADAQALYERYQAACKMQTDKYKPRSKGLNSKHAYRNKNFHFFFSILGTIVKKGSETLRGRDVGFLRTALAGWLTKKGAPGSEKYQKYLSTHPAPPPLASSEYVDILLQRLNSCGSHLKGLFNPEEVCYPIMPTESQTLAGLEIPPHLALKVHACRLGKLEELADADLIPSAEIFANLAPIVLSEVKALRFSEPHLQRLYWALNLAFSKRPSLMLLNNEHQVRLSELPWAKVLEDLPQPPLGLNLVSARTIDLLCSAAIQCFPQTIFPNKLVSAIGSIVPGGKNPFIEELAQDIFMGQFTQKFADQATTAAKLLHDTPYEAYYGLQTVYKAFARGNIKPNTLVNVCRDRVSGDHKSNGKILEQQLIVTTHNLAHIFATCPSAKLVDFAKIYERICDYMLSHINNFTEESRRAAKHLRKNIAYAFRQLVFFVSVDDIDHAIEKIRLAIDRPEWQKTEHAKRVREHWCTLLNVMTTREAPATLFLGWV